MRQYDGTADDEYDTGDEGDDDDNEADHDGKDDANNQIVMTAMSKMVMMVAALMSTDYGFDNVQHYGGHHDHDSGDANHRDFYGEPHVQPRHILRVPDEQANHRDE